ncbi:hypothetical protein [Vallitalea sp.]|jgi:hypothetical protein|uniref:hypothetical protein n=1 Tax=Vallitalea sp. TaxID=1882829 RepID=UPI0025D0D311|nr:hypothetical protein [Vallitalea sp.]MCT4685693.1 hypothetical protein [Vallitalea sp.]
MSFQKATYDHDRMINGQNYDNQTIFDMLSNNGIERGVVSNKFGVVKMTSRTGYRSFWPSNVMYDSMESFSRYKFNTTFHHLFVPYENGSSQPSRFRVKQYLNGSTNEKPINSLYDFDKP